MGFVVLAFPGAAAFLGSDHVHSTSCLIADVHMPGMTGIELHKRLVGASKTIPTILITAHPNERDRSRALRAGVLCYLAKPFKDDVLLACVHYALERHEADGSQA